MCYNLYHTLVSEIRLPLHPTMRPILCTELFDGLDIHCSPFWIDAVRQSASNGTKGLLFHCNVIVSNAIVFPPAQSCDRQKHWNQRLVGHFPRTNCVLTMRCGFPGVLCSPEHLFPPPASAHILSFTNNTFRRTVKRKAHTVTENSRGHVCVLSWGTLCKVTECGRCYEKFPEAWEAQKNSLRSSQTRNSPPALFQLCFQSIAWVTLYSAGNWQGWPAHQLVWTWPK